MADRKISDLTALTTPASGDYLPIVDISEAAAASKNKRVTVQSLFQGIPVNVGIGLTPATKLDIQAGTTTSSSFGLRVAAGTNASDYSARFNNAAGTFLAGIDGSGRVGIGTSSPWTPGVLDCFGNAKFGASSINGLYVGITSGIPYIQGYDSTTPSSSALAFYTGSSEAMRLDGSGRLLVGTSSAIPTAFPGILQVNYGGGYTADFGRFTNDIYGGFLNLVKGRGGAPGTRGIVQAGDILGQIDFVGDDGADLQSVGAFIRAQVDGTPGANDMPGRLVFSTTADGASSPTERLRIDSSGNVGIGTSTPLLSTLHVNTPFGGSAEGLTLQNTLATIAGRGTKINFRSSSADIAIIEALTESVSNSGFLRFVTTNTGTETEGMRIDSSGNVGIGTSSPTFKLMVVAPAGAQSIFLAGQTGVSNGYEITSTGSALTHVWSTAGGEKLRLTDGGNLGIGTTAPTTLLDVNADTVRVRTARTPASATATGDAGEICWDAGYIYVCTATNTWKRAALSTW